MKMTDKSSTLLRKIMHAKSKTSMWINFFLKGVLINLWIFVSLKKTSWAVKKFPEQHRTRTLSGTTSVLFIIHIDFQSIIHIDFILESQKYIYCAHTGVDPVCQPWVMHHIDTPTTLPKLTSPKTTSVEWNNCLPICGL